MPLTTITTTDGTRIYYKDWSTGQPVVFSHGWPLSADAWDDQMVFEEVTVPGSKTPRWGRGRIWRRAQAGRAMSVWREGQRDGGIGAS